MKNSTFQLTIISAEKTFFSGLVSSVILPGIAGSFGIYSHHAPLVSPLQQGVIVYTSDGVDTSLTVQGGIAEVNNGIATICIEQVEK